MFSGKVEKILGGMFNRAKHLKPENLSAAALSPGKYFELEYIYNAIMGNKIFLSAYLLSDFDVV